MDQEFLWPIPENLQHSRGSITMCMCELPFSVCVWLREWGTQREGGESGFKIGLIKSIQFLRALLYISKGNVEKTLRSSREGYLSGRAERDSLKKKKEKKSEG